MGSWAYVINEASCDISTYYLEPFILALHSLNFMRELFNRSQNECNIFRMRIRLHNAFRPLRPFLLRLQRMHIVYLSAIME